MSEVSHSEQHCHQSSSDEMLDDTTHSDSLTSTNWPELSSNEAAHGSIRHDLSLSVPSSIVPPRQNIMQMIFSQLQEMNRNMAQMNQSMEKLNSGMHLLNEGMSQFSNRINQVERHIFNLNHVFVSGIVMLILSIYFKK